MRTELKLNGHNDTFFVGDDMMKWLRDKFIDLRHKMKFVHGCCALDDAELLSVMLYTDGTQEVFRDIKTNMTGKQVETRKPNTAPCHQDVQNYLEWKSAYEQRARRSYKWPVL